MTSKTVCEMYDIYKTRRALGRVHVPPTKLFQWLAVNKTTVKPHAAAAAGRITILKPRLAAAQYLYVGFSPT